MNQDMNRRPALWVLIAVALVFGALVIGAISYNLGIEQGLMAGSRFVAVVPGEGAASAPRPAPAPYAQQPYYPEPYYAQPYAYRPFGAGFGGLFSLLFVGFGLFLLFGLIRRVFWRGPRGWWGRGHWGSDWWQNGAPSSEEWRRGSQGAQRQGEEDTASTDPNKNTTTGPAARDRGEFI